MYKYNFLVGVLLLVGLMATLVHGHNHNHTSTFPTFEKVANQLLCGRRFKTNFSNGGYSFTVRSSSRCISNTNAHEDDDDNSNRAISRRANILTFNLNSVGFPNFALRALHGNTDSNKDFFTRFGFDKIVEYRESGETAGFQPLQDTEIRTFYLSNLRRGSAKWSQVNCVNADASIDDEPIVCNATLVINDNSKLIQQMTIQAVVTPIEVEIQTGAGVTKVKKILTPNSIKLSVEIDGITYADSNTSIAIGGFFIIRGSEKREDDDDHDDDDHDPVVTGVKTARALAKDDDEEERPDEPTVNQGVVQVSDNSSTVGGGFFSWDKYVSVKDDQGVYTTVSLTTSAIQVEVKNDDLDDFVESDFKIARIWFSPNQQVSNLLWDPSAGAAEEQMNNSGNKISSLQNLLLTLLLSVILCLFML